MKVLVFGSLNIDYVYSVNHFVRPGETLSADDRQIFSGGKGLNQAIAFANYGLETWHAGAVGAEDSAPLLETLKDAGVHTDLVLKKEGSSGTRSFRIHRKVKTVLSSSAVQIRKSQRKM